MARKPYPKRQYPNWAELDPAIDRLLKERRTVADIAKDLGLKADTIRAHLRSRESSGTPEAHHSTPEHYGVPQEHPDLVEAAHLSTPESTEITEGHLGIPEHQGTLEGYQEVMEDVQQSVPETPHITTEEVDQSIPEHQSVPEQLDIPEEAHPSTPEVHRKVSLDDSTMEHSGVPARQDQRISTLPVHPGTPTEEDWELWTIIKARWPELEKMLSERQVMLSTPRGTPGHPQKKTYVFDVRHITLIDRYAQDHRLDLKDVIYSMCQEFFERHGYMAQE
jgi:predicted transcriptional regulator